MKYSISQSVQVRFDYDVLFGHNLFDIDNHGLRDVIRSQAQSCARVLVVIDDNVVAKHPSLISQLKAYGMAHQLDIMKQIMVVPGGEQIKNHPTVVADIYQRVADNKIDRHSYILAIGGGAVLDMVGYAAATAHRGIRLIRMPTTVLAQNDAGIGVKNSVNYAERKNYLGTFAPPYAVLNDFALLETLSDVDKRSGMAEAVKVALIKDPTFFESLYEQRFLLAQFESDAVEYMIYQCAKLHLDHIANSGDPFEMGSARPLDFGHWAAHKLEYLANYRIRHGEAVAIGIALDSLYSCRKGMITSEQNDKIWQLLIDLGFPLSCPELDQLDVKAALEEFREHLGGRLCITLLTDIGTGKEVNDIDVTLMQTCLDEIKSLTEKNGQSVNQG